MEEEEEQWWRRGGGLMVAPLGADNLLLPLHPAFRALSVSHSWHWPEAIRTKTRTHLQQPLHTSTSTKNQCTSCSDQYKWVDQFKSIRTSDVYVQFSSTVKALEQHYPEYLSSTKKEWEEAEEEAEEEERAQGSSEVTHEERWSDGMRGGSEETRNQTAAGGTEHSR